MKNTVALQTPAVSAYSVPTDAPEADGSRSWDTTSVVVVEIGAGAATGTGWTYAPPTAADVVREQLAPVVTGLDAFDIPAAHEAMRAALDEPGACGLTGCALSALDIALWDLKARLLELPLLRLLGAARDTVPVYGSGGFTTYHDTHLAAQLGGWVHGQRIPRVKIRIGEFHGRAVARDLARVRAARHVIGPHTDLYVDAGGAYTRKQAVRVGRALAALEVGWFEAPVAADDPAGLRLVRDAVVCDVATGGRAGDLAALARTVPAVDCVQADATRIGGLTAWLRAAALAQAHGLEISACGAPHAHAAVAACVPNLRHVEWFHDHVRIESMFFDGALDPTGGVLRPDGGIGHGLRLRTEEVGEYRVA
ncbi:enolase C-terminal domain-like protein [Streptomyces indicus]|uniref:L-alanine-DL-glutamate epimerase n=1 Tax=Streptomyces indicus TaxID=417292 RepID=A0A1G8UJC3_9ACTN|nr:enolase C-terminal domain-like protein [Streptomyces indicus]SDJ53869.1 L-alanine-DL-glutamate epimerase [Streptomyces indicus]